MVRRSNYRIIKYLASTFGNYLYQWETLHFYDGELQERGNKRKSHRAVTFILTILFSLTISRTHKIPDTREKERSSFNARAITPT